MTNLLRNQIEVTLGEKTYKARLTIDSIIQIEEKVGMGIIKLVQRMTEGDVRMSDVLQVLYFSLRGGGNDLSIKDVGKLVGDVGIVESTKSVAEILTKALVDSDEEDKENVKKKE